MRFTFLPRCGDRLWRGAGAVVVAASCVVAARGSIPKWTEPTQAELAMKAEPKAPGAPAVVLSYEEADDGETSELSIHVRVKVLTSGGVSAGQIEVPRSFTGILDRDFLDRLEARTIHEDGSVVPFVPSPSSMMVLGNGAHAIGLSQVQVGSIVEYIIHYEGSDLPRYSYFPRYFAPVWSLQGKYFIRSAHFALKLPDNLDDQSARWVANLPPGAELKRVQNRVSLELADVPAVPDEPFMPPASAAFYNVRFFYYRDGRDKYWGTTGNSLDYWWSEFYKPTKGLVAAVHDLTLPADSDELKLRKLYLAVQKLDNTDLTRVHLRREDEREKFREIQNSEDVWKRRRGSPEQLTLLFLALARAAGFQGYPIAVASRGQAQFDQNVLSWAQMDSLLAIVVMSGHEIFFDPGTKMCPFGRLAPWHANVTGVSTEAKVIKIRMTPPEAARFSRTDRVADVTLAADGSATGSIVVTWTGIAGLDLRQEMIRSDMQAARASLHKEMQALMPAGIEVQLGELTGVEDAEVPLTASFTISGKLGLATKKRVVLPAQFFVSTTKPHFTGQTRTQPIAFPNAYVMKDQMHLHLPAGFAIESLPDERDADLFQDSRYSSTAITSDGDQMIATQRALVLNRIDYKATEYANVHQYFSQIAGYDQDQIILATPQAVAGLDEHP